LTSFASSSSSAAHVVATMSANAPDDAAERRGGDRLRVATLYTGAGAVDYGCARRFNDLDLDLDRRPTPRDSTRRCARV
jgi:hypothetical protein